MRTTLLQTSQATDAAQEILRTLYLHRIEAFKDIIQSVPSGMALFAELDGPVGVYLDRAVLKAAAAGVIVALLERASTETPGQRERIEPTLAAFRLMDAVDDRRLRLGADRDAITSWMKMITPDTAIPVLITNEAVAQWALALSTEQCAHATATLPTPGRVSRVASRFGDLRLVPKILVIAGAAAIAVTALAALTWATVVPPRPWPDLEAQRGALSSAGYTLASLQQAYWYDPQIVVRAVAPKWPDKPDSLALDDAIRQCMSLTFGAHAVRPAPVPLGAIAPLNLVEAEPAGQGLDDRLWLADPLPHAGPTKPLVTSRRADREPTLTRAQARMALTALYGTHSEAADRRLVRRHGLRAAEDPDGQAVGTCNLIVARALFDGRARVARGVLISDHHPPFASKLCDAFSANIDCVYAGPRTNPHFPHLHGASSAELQAATDIELAVTQSQDQHTTITFVKVDDDDCVRECRDVKAINRAVEAVKRAFEEALERQAGHVVRDAADAGPYTPPGTFVVGEAVGRAPGVRISAPNLTKGHLDGIARALEVALTGIDIPERTADTDPIAAFTIDETYHCPIAPVGNTACIVPTRWHGTNAPIHVTGSVEAEPPDLLKVLSYRVRPDGNIEIPVQPVNTDRRVVTLSFVVDGTEVEVPGTIASKVDWPVITVRSEGSLVTGTIVGVRGAEYEIELTAASEDDAQDARTGVHVCDEQDHESFALPEHIDQMAPGRYRIGAAFTGQWRVAVCKDCAPAPSAPRVVFRRD